MEERLEKNTLKRLTEIGSLADSLGYHAFLVGGFIKRSPPPYRDL